VNLVVVSDSVESIEAYVAERASRSAIENYGIPFAESKRTFAFVARDDADGPIHGALLMTMSGGVAALDELVTEPPSRDEAAAALLRRFEETASYQNCHKLCARVKRDGWTAGALAHAGFRIAAVVERHYFQFDFVDFQKWLA
jgi:hypothetical protein